MRIGSLRQRLTIQRLVTVGSNNAGAFEPSNEWVDWKSNVPCSIYVRRGQEHFADDPKKRYSRDVWHFTVRYLSVDGVDNTMRVIHKGMTFDIRHIRPDAQYGREIVLECETHETTTGIAPLSLQILQTIPVGYEGEEYDGFSVSASGGTEPYTFSEESAGLPSGLSLNASTGAITGTPTTEGVYDCEITVTDSVGATASISFQIVVDNLPVAFVYAYTITAGTGDGWVGYMAGFGSISSQPIPNGVIFSTVSSGGEGGIEISGPQYDLQTTLNGLPVYINGVQVEGEWSFGFNVATFWASSGFPAFVSGQQYQVVIGASNSLPSNALMLGDQVLTLGNEILTLGG